MQVEKYRAVGQPWQIEKFENEKPGSLAQGQYFPAFYRIRSGSGYIFHSPLGNGVKDRQQVPPFLGEGVLHSQRHFIILDALH